VVRAAFQEAGEVDAVAFAAAEQADFFLLVGSGEAELRAVGAGVDFASARPARPSRRARRAEFQGFFAVADGFVDRRGVGEGGACLVHVRDFHGVAEA
jgi:hypothetical protein